MKMLKNFDPLGGLASNFSLQCHPGIIHEGHKNKRNDHHLKTLLFGKQILPVNTSGNL